MSDYDLELGEVPPRRAPPAPGDTFEEYASGHHRRNQRRRYARMALRAAAEYALQQTANSLVSRTSHNLQMPTPSSNLRAEMDLEGMTPMSAMTNATSTTNQSKRSYSTMQSTLSNMTTIGDVASGKRGPSATYRLHKAKYLKMDAMLKQLMFPLHRFKGIFGFVQNSGQGLNVAVPGTSTDIDKLAARSAFRSISFFKLRHTSPRYLSGYPTYNSTTSSTNQAKVLNGIRNNIGSSSFNTTNANQPIYSYFRRFANTPVIKDVALGTGSTSVNGAGGCPDPTATGIKTMSFDSGNYRQLWMDYNCADMERAALQEQPFAPNPPHLGNHVGASAEESDFATPQDGPQIYTGTATQPVLPYAWKDATMRIADGKLELDIQNGTRSVTIVEIVIHSMKQSEPGEGDFADTPRIYEAIWKANNAAYSEKTKYTENVFVNTSVTPSVADGTQQGGWCSFWDPKTPFLAVKGKYKAQVSKIANEVHRSAHILSPGESKTVTIMLGSLYYKLGNRSGFFPREIVASDDLTCKVDGAGTLAVAVGAFGVDCLEAMGGDGNTFEFVQTGATNDLEGAGFWVGKRPAPSSIVVAGKYEEAWYPCYLDAKQQCIADCAAPLPSIINQTEMRTLPLGTVAPIQVSAVPASSYFAPLGGGKAAEASQPDQTGPAP